MLALLPCPGGSRRGMGFCKMGADYMGCMGNSTGVQACLQGMKPNVRCSLILVLTNRQRIVASSYD